MSDEASSELSYPKCRTRDDSVLRRSVSLMSDCADAAWKRVPPHRSLGRQRSPLAVSKTGGGRIVRVRPAPHLAAIRTLEYVFRRNDFRANSRPSRGLLCLSSPSLIFSFSFRPPAAMVVAVLNLHPRSSRGFGSGNELLVEHLDPVQRRRSGAPSALEGSFGRSTSISSATVVRVFWRPPATSDSLATNIIDADPSPTDLSRCAAGAHRGSALRGASVPSAEPLLRGRPFGADRPGSVRLRSAWLGAGDGDPRLGSR